MDSGLEAVIVKKAASIREMCDEPLGLIGCQDVWRIVRYAVHVEVGRTEVTICRNHVGRHICLQVEANIGMEQRAEQERIPVSIPRDYRKFFGCGSSDPKLRGSTRNESCHDCDIIWMRTGR